MYKSNTCNLYNNIVYTLRKLHEVPHAEDVVAVVVDQMLEGGFGAG